ncbi:MAG: SRPBCC domain-containing protein [Jatrophihabitantaceae bacterium]
MTQTLGSLRRLDDKRGAVHMQDVYDTDITDLWSALTVPDRLARWIATVEGDLRVGGTVKAHFTSTWQGPVRIDVCTAPSHLAITLDPGTEDAAVIEAMLTTEGERTRLVIEERGLPLDDLHFHGAGWQAHFEDLGHYLTGGQPAWKARWEELTPAYKSLDPS